MKLNKNDVIALEYAIRYMKFYKQSSLSPTVKIAHENAIERMEKVSKLLRECLYRKPQPSLFQFLTEPLPGQLLKDLNIG